MSNITAITELSRALVAAQKKQATTKLAGVVNDAIERLKSIYQNTHLSDAGGIWKSLKEADGTDLKNLLNRNGLGRLRELYNSADMTDVANFANRNREAVGGLGGAALGGAGGYLTGGTGRSALLGALLGGGAGAGGAHMSRPSAPSAPAAGVNDARDAQIRQILDTARSNAKTPKQQRALMAAFEAELGEGVDSLKNTAVGTAKVLRPFGAALTTSLGHAVKRRQPTVLEQIELHNQFSR